MLRMIYRAFLAILAASAMFANGPAPVDSMAMPACSPQLCKDGFKDFVDKDWKTMANGERRLVEEVKCEYIQRNPLTGYRIVLPLNDETCRCCV